MTRLLFFIFAAVLGTAIAVPAVCFVSMGCRQEPPSPWHYVADLDSLPEDGQPRRFQVQAPYGNGWSRRPTETLGSVFVRRLAEPGQVLVLLPHHHDNMRVPVTYDGQAKRFQSCWRVRFDLDGNEIKEAGWRPMGDRMRTLPARVEDGQVFVDWSESLSRR